MADTAKRLSGPTQLTAAAVTQYTVPASTTTIVRHIRFANTDTVDRTITLSIGTDAVGTRLWTSETIAANGSIDWSGFIVLAAAEIVQAYADVTAKVNLTISGVEVT